MSEALKILNNIRTLRAQARECTLETLEEMLEKLEVVVNVAKKKARLLLKLKSALVNCSNIAKC
jgi:DNA-binding protein H-NS